MSASRTPATRVVWQALIAGLVAGVVMLAAGMPVLAQWGDPEPTPTATATPVAEEPVAAPSTVSPCDLVTAADVEPLLGADVTAMPDATSCTYIAGDLSGRAVAVSRVGGVPTDEGALAAAMEQLATALDGAVTPVDLGEEGFTVSSSALTQLTARTAAGDLLVLVLTDAGSTGDGSAVLTELGRTALSRM